jgi:ParB family chromosome partitioning protein
MSDYILEMKISELKSNPINSTIYQDDPDENKELKDSIEKMGLLEPITITKNNMVISGHRRLQAIRELGYETCECRRTYFENTTIATIELNRYRVKKPSEITREAEVLREELSKYIKKGRPLKGEERIGKSETITDVSKTLNISTTKLKKLLSIKNYEPELLKTVDMGVISVEKAYQMVRTKYIIPKRMVDENSYDNKNFRTQIKRLMEKYNPPFEIAYKSLLNHYGREE